MDINALLTGISGLVLGLVVVCRISSTATFYAKTIFLYVSLVFNATFLTIPYGLWQAGDSRKTVLFSALIVDPISHVLGIEWDVEFEEKIDKKKAYVILCNHQSSVDVLGMMKLWPHLGPSVATAKKELLLYTGPFGLGLYLCGTVFIDRMSSEKGRQAVNDAGKWAKDTGTSLFFYPEGTRNRERDGNLLPFKKGAFHVALDAGLPILPVVISQYDFVDSKRKIFDQGSVKIRVLKPVETGGFSKETIGDLIEQTRNTMVSKFQSISVKIPTKLVE